MLHNQATGGSIFNIHEAEITMSTATATARASGVNTQSILDEHMVVASIRAESGMAWARMVICGLALVRLVVDPEVSLSDTKYIVGMSGMLLGILYSVFTLVVERERSTRVGAPAPFGGWLGIDRQTILSVLVDAVAVTLVILPIAVWPNQGYTGLLHEPEPALFALLAVSAGTRLRKKAAIVGMVSTTLAYIGVIVFDKVFAATYGVGEITIAAIIFISAAILGYVTSESTKKLVERGAKAVRKAVEEAERARQKLGIFVSQEVAEELMENDEIKLGGDRQDIAVLFTDLRGFTTYTEKLEPEQVVREMNEYFTAMVEVIDAEGGMVDKFIGDAVMAVFGLRRGAGNPAAAAIRTGYELQQRLDEHNEDRRKKGLDTKLTMGVGIHYGSALAGTIGSEDRMQYTVIGDVVNTASRLESATKDTDHAVLISAAAVKASEWSADAKDATLPRIHEQGSIELRGREERMGIYAYDADCSQAWLAYVEKRKASERQDTPGGAPTPEPQPA